MWMQFITGHQASGRAIKVNYCNDDALFNIFFILCQIDGADPNQIAPYRQPPELMPLRALSGARTGCG